MDDAKLVLLWEIIKLIAAILITAAIASVIYWRIPVYQYVGDRRGEIYVYYFMTQLTVFFAGLWGYQAIRNFHQDNKKDEWIRACLFIHKLTWIFLLILPLIWVVCAILTPLHFHLPAIFAMIGLIAFVFMAFSLFFGSLLFLVLIVLTTITAFFIRGRFFLHLLTVYWLLAAHLLFWYLALEIAGAA